MNKLLALLLVCLSLHVHAQVTPGFNDQEAMDMIQLCNSYSYIELFNSDEEIIPEGYTKTYTSGVFGMDNKFQVYKSDKGFAVLNFRGSTDKKVSWLENFYSSMIPSQGLIQIQDKTINYKFATDTAAHVHAGYALGIAYLSYDLIFHINNLNAQGIYDIMLSGHSQGGALCQLLMAYVHNLPEGTISSENRFKTYNFAAPMVGNQAFVEEYDARYCASELSFSINNPDDVVPKLPLTYRDGSLLTESEITSLLNSDGTVDLKTVAYNGFMNLFENKFSTLSSWVSTKVGGQIDNELGTFEIPPYTGDISYGRVGNLTEIDPVQYPVHLKDSTILKNNDLLLLEERNADGSFKNQDLYKKGKAFYQHKPHNYYISMLKRFEPKRYKALDRKYLVENL